MKPEAIFETRSVAAPDYAAAGCISFLLYLCSAVLLDERDAITHFGADGHLYESLARGIVQERVARFHPVTIAAATLWMKLFGWLSAWAAPALILKAMFAAVGGAGVAFAVSALSVFMARREALLCGAIYALSFGVWYFASIEESKIVTATLSAGYVAYYLRIRENLNTRRILVLSGILLVACLNEITACLLATIPAVEFLFVRNRKQFLLLVAHVAAGVAALLVLELVARVVIPGTDSEGASHADMFFHYFMKNDHGIESLQYFLNNWFLFNIAAPTASAMHLADASLQSAGYFAPGLMQYLGNPLALAALVLLFGAFGFGLARSAAGPVAVSLFAVLAYSLVRGFVFFLFNPPEPLLFSPAVTIAHLLVLLVPFARSQFRGRAAVLAAIAACLFAANGRFFLGV